MLMNTYASGGHTPSLIPSFSKVMIVFVNICAYSGQISCLVPYLQKVRIDFMNICAYDGHIVTTGKQDYDKSITVRQ